MKKILVMFVLASAFAFVAGCSRKAVKEEPMPLPAPVVAAPELPVVVEPLPVDPKIAAAHQKYLDGLKQFDKADYKGALKTWQDCLKLDPRNEDCQGGARAAMNMIDNLAAMKK